VRFMNGKSKKTDHSCEDVRDLLDLLAAGDLPEDEAAEFHAHLDECDSCRAEYERIAEVAGVVGEELRRTADENFETVDLWSGVREHIAGHRPRRAGLRWLTLEPVRLISAAAVTTVALYLLVTVQWTADMNGVETPLLYESVPVVVTDAKIDARPAGVSGFEFGDGETVIFWLE